MAKKGLGITVGINFEDISSVKKKFEQLQGQVNKEAKNGIKLGLDLDARQINEIMSKLTNLTKSEIKILPSGEITTLAKYNTELGKTVSLKQSLKKEGFEITISDDKEKAYTKLFDEAIRKQEEQAKIQQQLNDAQWKEMEQMYKEEQQFIQSSSAMKLKASQQARKNAEAEAKIHNKTLEDNYKAQQVQQKEIENAQKLVSYEKQRLELKLKNINANRGSLVNEDYSNKIQEGINNLSGDNVKQVKEKVRQLTLEMKNLDQQARMKGLQIGNKSIMSFGEYVKNTATKLGIFASTAMLVNQVGQQFRNAVNYTIELDSALVNLKKVTDETDETYSKFLDNMHNVSMELGTQSDKMVDAVTSWAKTGKSLEEASKLAENTIMLTKVGDIDDVDTAQQYMLPALKAFNIEAENSIRLIDEYNNVSNNMATTVEDIGEAMSKSASSMGIAGNSLEQTIALIATAEAQTQLSGNEVGNALKSMSMRLATFKDDETGEIIPKMAESIKELTNVDITDINGQLKNTYDIYNEIGKVYKDLDKNSQMQLNEILGGKLRGNIVSAILSNVEELNRAYDLANNSAGSASNEFEKYTESIQYSLDRLKEKLNGLYKAFMNSGFVKGFADGMTGVLDSLTPVVDTLGTAFEKVANVAGSSIQTVISAFTTLANKFGTFPATITTIVTSMTLFNSKFRESTEMLYRINPVLNNVFNGLHKMSDNFKAQISTLSAQKSELTQLMVKYQNAGMSTKGFTTELTRLNGKLALSTAGLIATKVATIALQSAMSMGISLAISGIISGLSKLVDKLIVTKDEMKELNNEFSNLAESNNSASGIKLVNQYKGLQKQLATLKEGTNEYKKIEEELIQTQERLIALYPQVNNLVDENTGKKQLNLETTEKLIEKEQAVAVAEANKALERINVSDPTDDVQNMIGRYNAYLEIIDKINEAKEKGNKSVTVKVDKDLFGTDSYKIQTKHLDSWLESLDGVKESLKVTNDSAKILGATNEEWADANKLISETLGLVTDELGNIDSSNVDNATNAMEGLEDSVLDTKTELEDLIDAFSGFEQPIGLLEKAIEEYREYGILSTDTFHDILKSGNADLIALLGNNETFLSNAEGMLGQLQQEQQKYEQSIIDTAIAQSNASSSIISDLQAEEQVVINTSNTKIQASSSVANASIGAIAGMVNFNNKNYGTDVQNFINASNTKINGSDSVANASIGATAGMVSNLNNLYRTDASNFANLINSKLANIATFARKYASVGASIGQKIGGIDTSAGSVGSGYVGSGGVAGSVGHGNIGGGSGGSRGSGGSGSSGSAEKTVADIELISDAYYKLNNVVDDYNRLLEENRNAQELATGAEKAELIKKEIQLTKAQIDAKQALVDAYTKEAQGIRRILESQGFQFDSQNNLINSYEKLIDMKKRANTMSGSEKEAYIDNIKALEEYTEKFYKLTNNTIPDLQGEMESLKISIKETTTQALEDARDKLAEALKMKYEEEKSMKEQILDERIEQLQSELDALDDEEMDRRKKLLRLQQEKAKWERDDSVYGQKKVKELQDQIAELEMEIQKDELNNQIENIEKEKEKLEETYDELLEDKNIYNEADKLLTENKMEEMVALLEKYGQDFSDVGHLLGENFTEAFKKELELAVESLKYLKGEANSLVKKEEPKPAPAPQPTPAPAPQPSKPAQQAEKPVVNGSRVKITNASEAIYVDSYTGYNSGTWKGAGVSTNDTLYVVNDNNGRVALSRTNSIYGAIGWIDKKKVKAFDTGGLTVGEGIAYLHDKERILNQQQTQSFEKLVDMLPELINNPLANISQYLKMGELASPTVNNNNINIENNIEVNTSTDWENDRFTDNFEKLIMKDLRSLGINKTKK